MNKKNVVSVKILTKHYSKNSSTILPALDNLNLEVKEGEIFGLLGPNGAGKTTFLSILSGTVIKTSGEVSVWGFDLDKNPRQARASIGIVPQEVNLDPFFSPRKLLELQAGMYGVKKKDRITNTILKMVSLDKEADSYSRSLSGGMKKRLLIAKAMVHQPPILVLDEPTAGVDVELRKNLWKNVRLLNKLGVTIILTTHYLFEAQELCDRIAILNKGKLVALDTTKNLINRIKTKKIIFRLSKKINILNLKSYEINVLSNIGDEIIISYDKEKIKIEEIIRIIKNENVDILDISTEDGDLEDVFIELTKN
jgi:ABC-2 type transport system ATP-binding protein|tara:strand:- start:1102 stop:2031 length:930 start_codon:yes stop_codon:yes gene_type:complete